MAKYKILYIVCGAPGAGKSTIIKEFGEDKIVISRDAIRFSLVTENEPYFSKENLVFRTFIKKIQEALDDENGPQQIFCDATHIDETSRIKVLSKLNLKNVQFLIALVVRPSLNENLRRNKLREGRCVVPESAVKRMYEQFCDPIVDTKYPFDMVLRATNDDNMEFRAFYPKIFITKRIRR